MLGNYLKDISTQFEIKIALMLYDFCPVLKH